MKSIGSKRRLLNAYIQAQYWMCGFVNIEITKYLLTWPNNIRWDADEFGQVCLFDYYIFSYIRASA